MTTKIETYGQLLEKIKKLEAKYERTQEWLDRFQGDLAAKEIELLEAKAEWVKTFDDMVLVQQRTEAERDALRAQLDEIEAAWAKASARAKEINAENERLRKAYDTEVRAEKLEVERLRAALAGVLAEADRKTDAFDRARAELAHGN